MELQGFRRGCIYRCTCPENYSKEALQWLYHCRNWTFDVIDIKMDDSGTVIQSVDLSDTYFHNKTITVTTENMADFEFVFDRNDVIQIRYEDVKLYELDDVIWCRTDSAGKAHAFIKKGTIVSQARLIESLVDDRDYAKYQLEHIETMLAAAIAGTHYKLKS